MIKKWGLILCLLISIIGCQSKKEISKFNKGLQLIRENNYEEAILYFEEMITIDPQDQNGYTGIIIVAAIQKDPELIGYYIEEAIQNIPDKQESLFAQIKDELVQLKKSESAELIGEFEIQVNEGMLHSKTSPIWIMEPQFDFDYVDVVNWNRGRITADSFMNGAEDYRSCYVDALSYELMNERNCQGYYDKDYVKVNQAGNFSIYDFHGNKIKELKDGTIQYGYTITARGEIYLGYSITSEVFDSNGMIEYLDVEFYGDDFSQNVRIRGIPTFAVDGYFLNKTNNGIEYCNYEGCFGIETLGLSNGAYLIDSQTIVDQAGNVYYLNGFAVGGISNNFIRVSDKEINYWRESEPRIEDYRFGFYDIYGNQITEMIYENAYDFTGGYAAVKLDGMWGYIDTNGNIAIPFEFEETRPVYDGKGWAKRDGLWGILDVEQSVSKYTIYIKE